MSELESVREAPVIFDGSARMGEVLAILVRFVQEDFIPTQHLIQLEVLAKALKGDVEHNFGPNTIIGGIKNGASVNRAALR